MKYVTISITIHQFERYGTIVPDAPWVHDHVTNDIYEQETKKFSQFSIGE